MPIASLPATETVNWLLREAVNSATPGALLRELCTRLIDDKLPIASAVLSVASLDPLISASRLRWDSDRGGVFEEVMLHGMSASAAPHDEGALALRVGATSHRLEWRPAQAAGFTAQERDYLNTICTAMAAPLQAVVERGFTRGILRAYLGRRSAEKVLGGSVRRGAGEMIEAVIWIS